MIQYQEKTSYIQASARLTALKKQPELAWLNEVSCVPLKQALHHPQTDYRKPSDLRRISASQEHAPQLKTSKVNR